MLEVVDRAAVVAHELSEALFERVKAQCIAEMPLAEDSPPLVASASEHFCQRFFVRRHAQVRPRLDGYPLQPVVDGVAASQQRHSCGRADRSGVEPRQLNTLGGDAVDVGSREARSVKAYILPAKIVCENDHDVRQARRLAV